MSTDRTDFRQRMADRNIKNPEGAIQSCVERRLDYHIPVYDILRKYHMTILKRKQLAHVVDEYERPTNENTEIVYQESGDPIFKIEPEDFGTFDRMVDIAHMESYYKDEYSLEGYMAMKLLLYMILVPKKIDDNSCWCGKAGTYQKRAERLVRDNGWDVDFNSLEEHIEATRDKCEQDVIENIKKYYPDWEYKNKEVNENE